VKHGAVRAVHLSSSKPENLVNRSIASAFAILAFLSGCAADGQQQQGDRHLDASYTPTGTFIPRKAPSRLDNVTVVDKQALENDRMNGNGTINLPQR
jgi:hypothetical protein